MSSNEPREGQAPPSRLSPTTPGAGRPAEQPRPPAQPEAKAPGAKDAGSGDEAAPARKAGAPAGGQQSAHDPLRGSRVSGFWATVVVLVIVLVLLAIFVLQNTQSVEIRFLGFSGSAPLAAAMMISAAAGLVVAVAAGSLRILQLRRRVKRERKADRPGRK